MSEAAMAVLTSRETDIPQIIAEMFPEECARGTLYDQRSCFKGIASLFGDYMTTDQPVGISVARNRQIEHHLQQSSEWMVMVDGDVLPPEGLLDQMLQNEADIVGIDIPRCQETDGFDLSCSGATVISHSHSYLPTRFACFHRSFLEKGFRYPAIEPFDQPGWGAEDNLAGVFAWLMRARIRLYRDLTYHHGSSPAGKWNETTKKRVVAWLAISILVSYKDRLRVMEGDTPTITIDAGVPYLDLPLPSWLHFEQEMVKYTPNDDRLEESLIKYFNKINLDRHALIGWSSSTTPG